MTGTLATERLLAIIRTQNEITATALDLDEVMAAVVERAQELTGASGAVIELADGEEMVYQAVSGTARPHLGMRLSAAASLSGLCVSREEVVYCEDSGVDSRVDAEACARVGALSLLCVPLFHSDRITGVLKVYAARTRAFGDGDTETLRLLSGLVAAHMAHAGDYERSQEESRTDALTGLANRREFDERLRSEISRARRHGRPLALLVLDLDGFKAVNDSLGHDAGDELLRAAAARLRNVRGEDGCFRLGGDEFAVLLVDASEPEATAVAARLRETIASDPRCRGIGASCGVATLHRGDDHETLLARADASMYVAKRSRGRESADDDSGAGSAVALEPGPAAA